MTPNNEHQNILIPHKELLPQAQLCLFASKLSAVTKRKAVKDYMDIAAMLRGGVRLEEGLSAAVTLYGAQFTISETVRTLTYFHGGDLDELSDEDKQTLTNAVKNLQWNAIKPLTISARELTALDGRS